MISKITEVIADQWRGLKKFAADLAADISALPARHNRGVKANLAILEAWLRAALLTLAEEIEPPKRKLPRRTGAQDIEREEPIKAGRRMGFRCIVPDAYEKDLAAENRFGISKMSGVRRNGPRRDPRPAYRRRLAAIAAVLDAPELYARRVKRKLEERKKRPNLKRVNLVHRSALPELLNVPRRSDLGRFIWYNDTS